MWELDCEEGWASKNWCFWTVVLGKTLESPLDCKEIQPVHSERDQPWVFFGRNDAEAEAPVLWPPHVKRWLTGKDSDAGRDWGQEEKRTSEDEMAGWHHGLNGRDLSELQEMVMDREAWRAEIHGVTRSRTRLSDWTELNWFSLYHPCEEAQPLVLLGFLSLLDFAHGTHAPHVPFSSDSYYSEFLLNIIFSSNDIPFFQSWSTIFLVPCFYLCKHALQSVCIGYWCISPPDVNFSKSKGSVIVQQFVILKKWTKNYRDNIILLKIQC